MWGRIAKIALSLPFLIVAGLFGLYLVFGFFLVNPHLIYVDANRASTPFTAVLEPLGIELDGLSTLPEDRGDYLVAAKLPEQGGTLKWKVTSG